MNNPVYLIIGITGEWTGHTEWTVAAYRELDVAQLHCDQCNQWLAQKGLHSEQEKNKEWNPDWTCVEYETLEQMDEGKLINTFDPDGKVKYTGANYVVIEVPSFLHPDEFIEWQEQKERKK